MLGSHVKYLLVLIHERATMECYQRYYNDQRLDKKKKKSKFRSDGERNNVRKVAMGLKTREYLRVWVWP